MTRPLSDSQYMQRLQGQFAAVQPDADGKLHPAIDSLADDSEYIDAVIEWLKDLRLLKGVPFNHLAADPDLLPQDSIRFFHVDQNWLNALLDGSLSVGSQSATHVAMQSALHPELLRESRARAPMARRRPRGFSDQSAPPSADTWTGFLLRSPVVYAYPGLEVTAFQTMKPTADGKDYEGVDPPLDLLRMDRLAPDVMICLFNGFPSLVQINEPLEGLAFGTQDTGAGSGKFQLRGLGEQWSDGKVYWQAGEQIIDGGNNVYADVAWRDQALRTVDICSLYATLPTTLSTYKAHQVADHFGPADFALQLLSLPEKKKFYNVASSPSRTTPEK